ncbi:RNase adapter RapZ [Thermosulfurimonas sp. F29]|uniref:RNase adapter RapZ n=1 Tax=Thermosulfurimonas sp. F29 TaxID=2867247 RepID=UPI001C839F3B|nr:RNase adapter RapZ [Thermosulfurimonas sp. F29]MBX6423132.1 RNase adapter RapZ [Thermosulfurimonas sp. F29]
MTESFNRSPELVIISGLSGSGKSTALKAFEDLGYFCVDNLPPDLLPPLLGIQKEAGVRRIAVVMDIRSGIAPEGYTRLFERLREMGCYFEVLFLTAAPEVLLYRYSQTRRPHPLARDIPLREALERERELLAPLKEWATVVLDTSRYNLYQLREEIIRRYGERKSLAFPTFHLISFGFKYGIPAEAHFVFDLRFLPNPYFVPELKDFSGKDERIKAYVLKNPQGRKFMNDLAGLLNFVFPYYEKEGRAYVVVALGCTGGRHRSVAVVEVLAERLKQAGRRVMVTHRDLDRESS